MRTKIQHPDEDYWRLGAEINPELSIERAMKIIKDEREALLEFEKEASGVF